MPSKSRVGISQPSKRQAEVLEFIGAFRKKKGYARRLWQIQIGAATRLNGLPYNRFINGLKKSKIELDRKILSDLAQHEPEIFKKIVGISKSVIK